MTRDEPLLPEEFGRVDIRVGRVLQARENPEARKPAYVLVVDFGPDLGTRTSSAQLTEHYSPRDLVGRLVLAVVNFAPKRIAGVVSEALVLGVDAPRGGVRLVVPDGDAAPGTRLY